MNCLQTFSLLLFSISGPVGTGFCAYNLIENKALLDSTGIFGGVLTGCIAYGLITLGLFFTPNMNTNMNILTTLGGLTLFGGLIYNLIVINNTLEESNNVYAFYVSLVVSMSINTVIFLYHFIRILLTQSHSRTTGSTRL
jgi:hypothetical protein